MNTVTAFDRSWLNDLKPLCTAKGAVRFMLKHGLLLCDDDDSHHIRGNSHQHHIPALRGLADDLGFTVHNEMHPSYKESLGLCRARRFGRGGEIYLAPGEPNNVFRTFVHELTHALGANKHRSPVGIATDEITAEGSAFLVSRELDLDTRKFSFPYLSYYLTDERGKVDLAGMESYAERILRAL